jgi:DNA repair exonuclease SbcCD ATPase subunit
MRAYEATLAQWQLRQETRQAAHAQRVAERRAVSERLAREVDAQRDALMDATDAAVDTEVADLVAQQVAKVLSARGVRAFVLGEALIGVEQVANAWLSRMAPGISLALKAYSENKTGTVSDRISLEVTGAGGGYGYDASSGGERRRVDAAILLALAEVSAAARGISRGTLFLDEVFDAVDAEGVPLVAEAIEELGKTRPVVVITHSQELTRHMRPHVHMRADCGTLSVVT